jgi:prefoldin subunit 5
MDNPHKELVEARINIARLQEQVDHLTAGMEDLQETNKELNAKIDQVLLTLSEARGGWKTLVLVGGAASALGGAVTWFAAHFKG